MKKRLFIFIFSFITLLGCSQLSTRSTNATTDCGSEKVPQEVLDAAGCSSDTNTAPTEPPLVNTAIRIINGIIAVLSIVAVIFIIYSGIQYMISAGDTGKTKRAKDTILYAAIGLIVCALAAGIVNFVVVNLLNGGSASESSQSSS